jgi:GAF domain-containing protein
MVDVSRMTGALAEFARTLTRGYDVYDVLHVLTHQVRDVLDLDGAGVTLSEDGRLRFVTADRDQLAPLERAQLEHAEGPCVDAVRSGAPVLVTDLRAERERWPEYTRQADALGIRATASVPMQTDRETIGTLYLYSARPRTWTEAEVTAARVLADMATGYVRNASELERQRRLTEQLQEALDTRVVIEQAKGVVAASRGITVDEAFRVLRKHANDRGATLRVVADAVVRLGLRP